MATIISDCATVISDYRVSSSFSVVGLDFHFRVSRIIIVESDRFIEPTPLIAPALGMIAAKKVTTALDPGQVKPLYIRPPDAVLARNRLQNE